MNKIVKKASVLLASSVLLMACGNDNSNQTGEEEAEDADVEQQEEQEEETNEKTQDSDEPQEVDKGATHGNWGDDELGLGIGDTATFSSNFVMAEITLDSVEQIEDEDAFYGYYTILHMTANNIGDEPAEFEDIFDSTELSDGPIEEDDDKNWGEYWEEAEVDGDSSEVGIGEEVSGSLVYDVEKVDEYEIYMNFNLSSTSNKISFEFNEDEIE